jgi:hypothetical protein
LDEARESFFASVRETQASSFIDNERAQIARLENTIIREALKAGGAGNRLKQLSIECREEMQTESDDFHLKWFERHYSAFPVRVLPSLAAYSVEMTLVEFLDNPKASPQFKGYAKAVALHDIDDSTDLVCCVFRSGRRLHCLHNMPIDNLFRNTAAAKNTTAVLINTDTGIFCFQWYAHFLKALGTQWCVND